MADDNQTSLGDDEQSFLLSGSSSLDGVDFRAAEGIDSGNVARSVAGTIGFALASVAATLVGGVAEAWTRVLDSLAGFIGGGRELVTGIASNIAPGPVYRETDGLIGTLTESVTMPMRAAWNSALPDTGLAAWIAGLALVLLTFYAAARGFDAVSEVLRE
ncbi:hypothetical protein DM2_2144 [Halorubrum sp. DM2]|uniref:hypothetical protein n=1 Tax=Halorubrum sp. DM2 TaxID=2527867 RepID=UPI0024B75DC2|nr:hypothetical protein [Halorubrum sp. DM2]VTT86106.1 hypothetical protein DM2_2144 [Halorubrum sp. DM2]